MNDVELGLANESIGPAGAGIWVFLAATECVFTEGMEYYQKL
jgi:hypothetical protein